MKFDMTIWLTMALIISLVGNAFLFWYVRKLLTKFLFVSQNLNDLVQILKNYSKHIAQVYKLDMFYGDETLEFLMSHTKSLIEILKDYEDVYDIAIPLEPQGEQNSDEEGNKEDESGEEAATEAPPTQQVAQENVFYAGSRRRDN